VRKLACVTAALLAAGLCFSPLRASSHREAPLISQDPLADNTDVYAFVSPERPDRVVLIADFIPLEFPSSGPNYWKFDDNVLYEIMVDNTGDAVEDVTYQFRFNTQVVNPNTFLYNTGQVTSIDDPDLNVRQFFTLTEVRGPRRTGTRTVIGQGLHVMPAHVGLISMPNYTGDLGSGVHQLSADGIRVFAGPRDDPFFVDLGATFDLLQLRTLNGKTGSAVDGLGNYNVHTLALEIPVSRLTRTGASPSGASDPNASIGVWSTASRPATTTRTPGNAVSSGDFVQVSRLGMPLVNEVVIPLGVKDTFNGLEPTGDGAALGFVANPTVPPLLGALFGVRTPPTPRNDLVTIFLTGIPGLNQVGTSPRPAEMIRLNTAIPPSRNPSRLGLVGGDTAGFPNGRRPSDDVVDIELRALAGGTPFTPAFNISPNNALGDGIDANDTPFFSSFPFLSAPHPGNEVGGPRVNSNPGSTNLNPSTRP
jgi:hypothetical protein